MKTIFFVTTLALTTAQAAVIYTQAFDYGNSQLDFGSDIAGWSDNTNVIGYVPGDNLSVAGYTGTGGALTYDFGTTGNRNATDGNINFDFGDYAAGDVFHVFTLGRANITTVDTDGPAEVEFQGGTVNTFGFRLSDTTMEAFAFDTGTNAERTESVGYTSGTTVSFLMQITKGNGSSPSDSSVEIWFNPDMTKVTLGSTLDTSGTGIGTANASFTSKVARNGDLLTDVRFGGDVAGTYTWDETRIVAIPEPGTLALVGIALGALALIRRRG